MLTKLIIENFKRFHRAEITLSNSVVFIGPNNSGKTTALQALALWDAGKTIWLDKRGPKGAPQKRPGVTINRRDLVSMPVPTANLLWKDVHTRTSKFEPSEEKSKTHNVRINIIVEGINDGVNWSCGLEFDYSNEESFVCRPIRKAGFESVRVENAEFTTLPDIVSEIKVAYLPPMSGLAGSEAKLETGRLNVLLGEGQTAQILRNLCYSAYTSSPEHWSKLVHDIEKLFGSRLQAPRFLSQRGEIEMSYIENGVELDLSSSGRGLQQTLLLLSYLYSHPKSVLLLDEPDAHLEVLRQRQIYNLVRSISEQQKSQIIIASHSEVVLNEAAGTGTVIAFVGEPHQVNDRGSQEVKALTSIGWEQYIQAEQKGWVLYLEGSSDLEILRALAKRMKHPATEALEQPFVFYVSGNLPRKAQDHFYGLKNASPKLLGIAIFDRIQSPIKDSYPLIELMWEKREIENYICTRKTLISFCDDISDDDLFANAQREHRVKKMEEAIHEVSTALSVLEKEQPFSDDIKASDSFLAPVFSRYYRSLGLPIETRNKSDYHRLAYMLTDDELSSEVSDKLDRIYEVYQLSRATENL